MGTIATELRLKFGHRKCLSIADGLDPGRLQVFLSDFSYARHSPDWRVVKERLDFVRLYHKQTVRLALVGSNLCKKLVWRNTRRRCQVQLPPDLLSYLARYLRGSGESQFVLCDVEVGFIERQGPDQISMTREDFTYRKQAALYWVKSGGMNTARGHNRSARSAGIAERMPNFRAS